MKKITVIVTIFIVLNALFSAGLTAKAQNNIDKMKVKLVNNIGNKTSLTIIPSGDYTFTDKKISIKSEQVYTLKTENEQLIIINNKNNTIVYKGIIIALQPSNSTNNLSINGKQYNGSFQFIVENKKYIRPINEVDIETYLRGVVPQEMPALWPMESLKAQTIVARTYALKHKNNPNFNDTISYQVYDGLNTHPRSDTAIEQTEGMVVQYNNQLVDALFSSSNGGKTEVNSNVWGTEPVKYLTVKNDPYDYNPANKNKFPWTINMKQQQINVNELNFNEANNWWDTIKEIDSENNVIHSMKEWLKEKGYTKNISDVKIAQISTLDFPLNHLPSGGRVQKGSLTFDYIIKETKNNQTSITQKTINLMNQSASSIRAVVGIINMRSYLVDKVEQKNGSVLIEGRGYGHGVGLSQYGARNRAEAGHNYKQILAFYYPNTNVAKLYGENDRTAPKITNVKISTDYQKMKTNVKYNVNETTKVTVTIKNKKGKTVKTIVNNKDIKAGLLSFYWSYGNAGNGSYTAELVAIDASGNKAVTQKSFSLKRPTQGIIKASSLNIRKSASAKAKVVGNVKRNAKVTILSTQGAWYQIKYGKSTGYIHSKYVLIKK